MVTVPGLSNVTEVAVGEAHACARRGDGRVFCWGGNSNGQVGNGSTDPVVSVPVDVGVADAEHVVVGDLTSCAITHSGPVLCWGGWNSVELPTTDTGQSITRPVAFPQLAGQEQLALRFWANCEVSADHALSCWGTNVGDQLGVDDPNASFDVPTRVEGLSNVRSVALGDRHACALGLDGSVSCWGANDYGALGDGTTTMRLHPARVALP
jgi:alpha-tubulin suppressor-like RCC1 family protein